MFKMKENSWGCEQDFVSHCLSKGKLKKKKKVTTIQSGDLLCQILLFHSRLSKNLANAAKL